MSDLEQVEGLELLQLRANSKNASSKEFPSCLQLWGQVNPSLLQASEEAHPDVPHQDVALPMGSDKKAKEDAFNTIYEKDIWTHGSGPGSTAEATVRTRKIITAVLGHIAEEKRKAGETEITMLDAPCGDMQWMPLTWQESQARRNGVVLNYHGADISTVVLEKDRAKLNTGALFPAELDPKAVKVRFSQIDLSSDPIGKYDVIFMKDVLGHLHNNDIRKVLANVRNSGSKYLLTTTDPSFTNADVDPGDFWWGRPVNVMGQPYNLDGLICMDMQVSDHSQPARLALFDLEVSPAPADEVPPAWSEPAPEESFDQDTPPAWRAEGRAEEAPALGNFQVNIFATK